MLMIFRPVYQLVLFAASLLLIRWDRCKKTRVMVEEALHDLMPNYNSGNYGAKFILIPQNLYFNSHCYLVLEQETNILRWMEEEIPVVSGQATQNLGIETVLASTC